MVNLLVWSPVLWIVRIPLMVKGLLLGCTTRIPKHRALKDLAEAREAVLQTPPDVVFLAQKTSQIWNIQMIYPLGNYNV